MFQFKLIVPCHPSTSESRALTRDALLAPKTRADGGDAEASFEYVRALSSGLHGPYDPAAPAFYFKLSADKLHGGAEHRYAQLLSHGFGVSADPAQAAAYFKRASDHGITEADCDDGSGADTQTVDTLRRKAIAGDADAQCGFAVALLKGRGVPRDAEEVRAWLKVAADAGNTRAQILFAVTIGWPEAAKRWAALASGAGNTVAKFELWLNGWVE